MMSGKKRKREGEEEESVRINCILNERYLVLENVLIGPFRSYSLWLAQDTGNPEKREVKIKVQKRGEKYTKAAKREMAILKRIVVGDQKDEKCVVKLLDAFNHEGHVCMVFESMGQDLSTLIRNGSGIPILRVKQICHDVLVGLDYLQQLSIIHTDLIPQNILLLPENSSDSRCKLIEFGKARGTGEECDNVIGQREYRCPEVILGCKYSTAADLWSFACIAFELATGNSLFKQATDMEHLALMTELLGVMPRKLALGCPLSSEFYTKDVDLKRYHSFNFKTLDKVLKKYIFREQDANDMANFLLPILAFDPEKRPTAGQCLHHPWIDPGPRRLQAVVRIGNIAINADSQGQPKEAGALPGED